MLRKAKSIEIFLPSGDPNGIRVANLKGRLTQLIEVPRISLSTFLGMEEADNPGVYILFGTSDNDDSEVAYIGQSTDLKKRLKQQYDGKEFWDRALVVTSLAKTLNVAHVLFLEELAINRAKLAGRYDLKNGTNGNITSVSAATEAECLDFFENWSLLLSTLGFPIFKSLNTGSSKKRIEQEDSLSPSEGTPEINVHIKNKDADAHGKYTEEGMIVEAGSYGRATPTDVFAKTTACLNREKMVLSGLLKVEGEKLFFTKDILFRSPSAAAMCVVGRSANGWNEWKNERGVTLRNITEEKL